LDVDKLKQATRLFLEAIGEDPQREGLLHTPERVAAMYQEIFAGIGRDPADELDTMFHEDIDGPVIVRDLSFHSVCEHHLLPFFGLAHIAYLPPPGIVVGVSKLGRVLNVAARRPQLQERLTNIVADAIERRLGARGVAVVVEAEHLCMSMRGIKKPGQRTVTVATRGVYAQDPAARAEILALLARGRVES